MGEIAEMMLEGTLCEQCGEYLGDYGEGDWEPEGIPGLCGGCAADPANKDDHRYTGASQKSRQNRIACQNCGKRVKGDQGLADHMRDKH